MADKKDIFLEKLVAEHSQALANYLARKMDSPEDAAEVAQEAFLRLHRLEQPQSLDNARAFLFQVATNLATDQLRRRSLHLRFLNREKAQVTPGEPAVGMTDSAGPDRILGAQEKLATIYSAVNELPFKVKQAFLMHRRNGMSYQEIAAELGVSVSSVEKYILQALKHCRERLVQRFPPEEDPTEG